MYSIEQFATIFARHLSKNKITVVPVNYKVQGIKYAPCVKNNPLDCIKFNVITKDFCDNKVVSKYVLRTFISNGFRFTDNYVNEFLLALYYNTNDWQDIVDEFCFNVIFKDKEAAAEEAVNELVSCKDTGNTELKFIGWLAKHITRIYGEAPGTMEKSIRKNVNYFPNFSDDTFKFRYGKYDSGFPKRFTLELYAHLNTKEIPEDFRNYIKVCDNGNFYNTRLLMNMFRHYGFQLGQQDIDNIRQMLSIHEISDFNSGYCV